MKRQKWSLRAAADSAAVAAAREQRHGACCSRKDRQTYAAMYAGSHVRCVVHRPAKQLVATFTDQRSTCTFISILLSFSSRHCGAAMQLAVFLFVRYLIAVCLAPLPAPIEPVCTVATALPPFPSSASVAPRLAPSISTHLDACYH